jgi:prophage antirepressor-like protein
MTSNQINLFNNESLNVTIKTITDDNNVLWFRAKDIALFLGYKRPRDAVQRHVYDKYKTPLHNIGVTGGAVKHGSTSNSNTSIYINEQGLYQLVFSSNLPNAMMFTDWVVEEVLPSIRQTGKYILYEQPLLLDKQISLMNEKDLHFKVIDYIRKYYPHALLYAGLGELQDTVQKRIYAKSAGYMKGQSDIIINNLHKTYNGLTIELKTPNGKGITHEKQHAFMNMSSVNGHKVLLSNDYDEILTEIINYMRDTRLLCVYCSRKFKNVNSLTNHHKYIHRISNI